MKAYTDLEQSKKLAEILPLESADMIWYGTYCGMDGLYHLLSDEYNEFGLIAINKEFCKTLFRLGDEHVDWLPCWSLAALLEQLPYELCDDDGNSVYLQINKEDDVYQLVYTDPYGDFESIETDRYDDFVDAFYEMIIKLKENNLL